MALTSARRATVVIVDDHPAFLAGIGKLVQVECDVLAAFGNGQQAVEGMSSLNPDVIVLDISMPGMDGFAVARRLRDLGMKTEIVFLTAIEDPEFVLAARALGACLIVKRRMHQELMNAIRAAADNSRANHRGRRDEADAP